jgi:DNA-nicking Smr family endonuclease
LARAEEDVHSKLRDARYRAVGEGRAWDALALKVQHDQARERAARLHRRAERRFVLAHNMHQSGHVIDVHGLKVPEARARVERALRDALVAGAPRLRVITGRGNHSVDNIPVLKTRITEAMAEYVCCSPRRAHRADGDQVSHPDQAAPDEPRRALDRADGGGRHAVVGLACFRVFAVAVHPLSRSLSLLLSHCSDSIHVACCPNVAYHLHFASNPRLYT